MTLHWWMHWFWVTAHLAGILASPLPSTTEGPRIHDVRNLTVESMIEVSGIDPQIIVTPRHQQNGEDDEVEKVGRIPTGTSFRVAKAISSYDSPTKKNTATANNNPPVKDEISEIPSTTRYPLMGQMAEDFDETSTRIPAVGKIYHARTNSGKKMEIIDEASEEEISSVKRDSRITWLLTTSRTPTRRKNDGIVHLDGDIVRNFSINRDDDDEVNKDLTVLPLTVNGATFKLVVNRTRTITADTVDGFRTFNRSEDIEIDQELAAEPRLTATASSILQAGISESTRLSRARNAFTSEFQRDREEDRSSEIDVNQVLVEANESVNREIESSASSSSLINIAAITGSCLATVVLLSTMASLGFIMYRRKYLNPPQTLNSDKCSNPDSSGYIDDSTIRDNSEEMYSLDNDSFLNSLEAMTIQNYWTDSVKHTKL